MGLRYSGTIGPYAIEDRLDRGGMAEVYLAADTRSGQKVALKVVTSRDTGILEAERRGAVLQSLFSEVDARVPRVFEAGDEDGQFYVAMELIPGEPLSRRIARGPLPGQDAVAIALEVCDVLRAAHGFCPSIGGREHRGIVHGDIKPQNIQLDAEGRVRVLDFGIAKALSATRRLTRNEFGSLPYSSPERLDSGDVDPSSDLWSLGVVLYEMVAGVQPFQAPNAERLEWAIRARTPPPPLPQGCPAPLAAVVHKSLAASLEHRYASAADFASDLEALARGESPSAEREGARAAAPYEATRRIHGSPPATPSTPEPAPAPVPADESTRRTSAGSSPDADATRRTAGDASSVEATARTGAPGSVPVVDAVTSPAAPASRPARRPVRRAFRWLGLALGAFFLLAVINEALVAKAARDLQATLTIARKSDAEAVWSRYQALDERSWIGLGTAGAKSSLQEWLVSWADRLLADYRSDVPTIRERGWKEAVGLLSRALALAPGDRRVKARLRYCEGHLARIDGQARKGRNTHDANRFFNEAVASFHEAAALWPKWPDPHLGLARTYIYGFEDLDRAIQSLDRARDHGYSLGNRETALLADGYRQRATRLWDEARTVHGMPQEQGYLERIREDCRKALELYDTIPAYGNVSRSIRATQSLLEQVEERLDGWW